MDQFLPDSKTLGWGGSAKEDTRMRMQSCPDHCEPDVCQLWTGGKGEESLCGIGVLGPSYGEPSQGQTAAEKSGMGIM